MANEKKEDKPKFDIWVKPNKTEIRLNRSEATVEKAKEMKWKKKGSKD